MALLNILSSTNKLSVITSSLTIMFDCIILWKYRKYIFSNPASYQAYFTTPSLHSLPSHTHYDNSARFTYFRPFTPVNSMYLYIMAVLTIKVFYNSFFFDGTSGTHKNIWFNEFIIGLMKMWPNRLVLFWLIQINVPLPLSLESGAFNSHPQASPLAEFLTNNFSCWLPDTDLFLNTVHIFLIGFKSGLNRTKSKF